jgi:hypothetical protein
MMEVVVGAALGAVAGSGLTIFTSYVQMRMKRDEGPHEIFRGEMEGLWKALHEGQRKLITQRLDGTIRRSDFNTIVAQLAGKISQLAMVARGRVSDRLGDIMVALDGIANARNHGDDELFRIANEIIIHAQWVCAAFLMNEDLPEEMPRLREYCDIFGR